MMVSVVFEGAASSGKSHLLALVGTLLREKGLHVTIQAEKTHNAEVLQHTTEQLVSELSDVKIILTEIRTS